MTEVNRYRGAAVALYPALIDPLLGPLRPKVVRLCLDLGVSDVLDIASATGIQCRLLASAGLEVTGVDLSPGMIDLARRRGGRPRYVEGSALDLPFTDASFDASLLLLALHEHPEGERRRMLGEALRVTRTDGWLIVADYRRPSGAWIHPPWGVICGIEAIAGEMHHQGFRDFVRQGGLDGLLLRHGLTPRHRLRSHFGTLGLVAIEAGASR
jgi:SAM-dependent methyltransferase